MEFSESERRKMLADLEVKEEETRILKKGIEQLKMEINGQKIELDSKRAINQRVGQNEQNLFKQVTELKQQIAEQEQVMKRKQEEIQEVHRELMTTTVEKQN